VHERGARLSGIVTFSSALHPAQAIQAHLRDHHINTSIVRRQNTLLDFPERKLGDINRASVHYYNTDTEIDAFCTALSKL
jgi:selenocysteine lyase/cysteine desulfurase